MPCDSWNLLNPSHWTHREFPPASLNVGGPHSQPEVEIGLGAGSHHLAWGSVQGSTACLTDLALGSQNFSHPKALTSEKATLKWHRRAISPCTVDK